MYIGVSTNPYNRLEQHRETSEWGARIGRMDVMWFNTEPQAYEAEEEEIRRNNPPFNKQHNKGHYKGNR